MAKAIFKNITDGPKVLNSQPVIVLQAGEATPQPVEISDAESDSAILSEWFEVVKPTKAKASE